MPGEIINGVKRKKGNDPGEMKSLSPAALITSAATHRSCSSAAAAGRSSKTTVRAAAPAQKKEVPSALRVSSRSHTHPRYCILMDQWFQGPVWHALEHVSEIPQGC